MCMGEGDQGINTCAWGRGTKELIHVWVGDRGPGTLIICVCVCVCGGGGGGGQVIHVCVEVRTK